jgi:hypothetical protein
MSFTLDVKKFADSFIDGAEEATRGTTIKLFSAIINSSPVDEGRFRANWFATGKQPSEKVTFSTDKNGSSTISKLTSKVEGIADWSTFTLTNNLPYSEVIEFGGYNDGPNTVNGFSKQAPAGVVRVNIMRFNSLLEAEARKNLPK